MRSGRPVQEDWHIRRHRMCEVLVPGVTEPSTFKAMRKANKVATLEDYPFFMCGEGKHKAGVWGLV